MRHVTGSDEPAAKSESQLARRVEHRARPVPVPRQVLVVEHRRRAAIFAKDVNNLAEEFVARILFLPQPIDRIVAMFADDEDGIHGELIAAAPQRLGDGGIDGETELLGTIAAQIVGRRLIDIGGDDIERRPMPLPAHGIADEKAFRHVPGVRAFAPFGGDDGKASAAGGLIGSPGKRGCQGAGGGSFDEGAACEHRQCPPYGNRPGTINAICGWLRVRCTAVTKPRPRTSQRPDRRLRRSESRRFPNPTPTLSG